jgi:transcriptional regulator with XRE-family HTH domain
VIDPLIVQLKSRREELGFSRKGLARVSGLGPPTIVNAEEGRSSPTLSTLRRWTAVLRLDLQFRDVEEG